VLTSLIHFYVVVLLEQNGWISTRGSYSHGGKHRFIAMAHSNRDMNIDEAVSDIRPYQFEPLLGTASVVTRFFA
jgi:hypothetical protein